ncbi:MaoC family dehydratase N-terminal domain-containing protein [Rhodococcus jostii]|uniref:MaoC family dehydratase N-terminal domain-containing protein n=1 Tax=Rhodococcus jostii TaxID=132919 RepID=UPI00365F52FE
MPLDTSAIGKTRPGGTLLITRSRLQLFAKATGQTDPIFIDVEAARAAGHPDLPVPPTFYAGVEWEIPDPLAYMVDLGIDLRFILHGGQEFIYHAQAHAGDELSSSTVISDVYKKKGGALNFMISETSITNQNGDKIVTLISTIVVRQPAGATS